MENLCLNILYINSYGKTKVSEKFICNEVSNTCPLMNGSELEKCCLLVSHKLFVPRNIVHESKKIAQLLLYGMK